MYSQALFQKRLLVPVAVAAATRCGAFPWFPHSADKYITTGQIYHNRTLLPKLVTVCPYIAQYSKTPD